MERKKLIKSEVIRMFNTTIETLRHYENKGLLTPEVSSNNYRYYDFYDLQKLRQIFMLRDLGLTIDEMKRLDHGEIKESEYITLLGSHQQSLQEKIRRLQEINVNITQLMELMEASSDSRSFRLRPQRRRLYYVLSPVESDVMESPKAYFDRFQSLIQSSIYTEQTLQIAYDYVDLSAGDDLKARICIEVPEDDNKMLDQSGLEQSLILESGTYLSIFYPFEHGNFSDLPRLKKEIDAYLDHHGLTRTGSVVIEKEHPELSLFLPENVTVYELQIRV